MVRSLCIIATVAALSGALSHLEQAHGERHLQPQTASMAWIRTVDGWEPSTVLSATSLSHAAPALHPFLVAGFQLVASVFVLLAFPYRKPALS